jgi:Putative zinc-finger
MSDIESVEFDDELLSAYLDDELAPEERARVEARLAADPRSKQLLDELRAVSQAMKAMPAATVGSDLRESVLRRAERAMLVPEERAPADGAINQLHRLPFGRSKRAWIWAGMALAAGLMLMFFDREPERNQGLPGAVARRDRAESKVESLSEPRSSGQEEVDALAAARPAAPASAPALAPASARVSSSAAETPLAAAGAGGYGGGAAVAGDQPEQLRVYLNVKPEALESGVFDAVLARNQIEVEQAADRDSVKETLADTRQAPRKVDVLLLEAAPKQIESTLADLNADHRNYLDIEVEDARVGSQESPADDRSEIDFKQYSRGIVPSQQKSEFASNRGYYYETEQVADKPEQQLRRAIESPRQLSSDNRPQESNRSRALRLQPQSAAQRGAVSGRLGYELQDQSAVAAQSPAAAAPPAATATPDDYFGGTQLDLARRAKQKLAAKADMLQVLFVLTANAEPAASPPAAAKSVTSPTAGEGIEE